MEKVSTQSGLVGTSLICPASEALRNLGLSSSFFPDLLSALVKSSSNLQAIIGSIFLMVGHGVVSSGLFLCIGALYDRYSTRIVKYYSGLVFTMPIFSNIIKLEGNKYITSVSMRACSRELFTPQLAV